MKLEEAIKGTKVQLAIPASRPIKTMDGNLHEAGQDYKILGYQGTCIRLSRVSDKAKLIIPVENLVII